MQVAEGTLTFFLRDFQSHHSSRFPRAELPAHQMYIQREFLYALNTDERYIKNAVWERADPG